MSEKMQCYPTLKVGKLFLSSSTLLFLRTLGNIEIKIKDEHYLIKSKAIGIKKKKKLKIVKQVEKVKGAFCAEKRATLK